MRVTGRLGDGVVLPRECEAPNLRLRIDACRVRPRKIALFAQNLRAGNRRKTMAMGREGTQMSTWWAAIGVQVLLAGAVIGALLLLERVTDWQNEAGRRAAEERVWQERRESMAAAVRKDILNALNQKSSANQDADDAKDDDLAGGNPHPESKRLQAWVDEALDEELDQMQRRIAAAPLEDVEALQTELRERVVANLEDKWKAHHAEAREKERQTEVGEQWLPQLLDQVEEEAARRLDEQLRRQLESEVRADKEARLEPLEKEAAQVRQQAREWKQQVEEVARHLERGELEKAREGWEKVREQRETLRTEVQQLREALEMQAPELARQVTLPGESLREAQAWEQGKRATEHAEPTRDKARQVREARADDRAAENVAKQVRDLRTRPEPDRLGRELARAVLEDLRPRMQEAVDQEIRNLLAAKLAHPPESREQEKLRRASAEREWREAVTDLTQAVALEIRAEREAAAERIRRTLGDLSALELQPMRNHEDRTPPRDQLQSGAEGRNRVMDPFDEDVRAAMVLDEPWRADLHRQIAETWQQLAA